MTTLNADAHTQPIQVKHRAKPQAAWGFGPWVLRVLGRLWRWLFASLLCQSALGAVIVVGWVRRGMQRAAFKYWVKRGDHGRRFEDYVADDPDLAEFVGRPKLVLEQNTRHALAAAGRCESADERIGATIQALFRSLWVNLKGGLGLLVATHLVTLPLLGLMAYGWFAGWNISFNKQYELAAVGPATVSTGMMLFGFVMLFIPMAQARQAATGQWRAFFDLPFITGVVKRHWLSCFGLLLLYMIAATPVMGIRSAVAFIGSEYEEQYEAALQAANQYYFLATLLFVVPAYIALHWLGAKVYAHAVLKDLRRGKLSPDDLSARERRVMSGAGLLNDLPAPKPVVLAPPTVSRGLGRSLLWVLIAVGWSMLALLAVSVWVSGHVFVSKIVGQFLNYIPDEGWTNQPMVHMPIVRYIPDHLMQAVEAVQAGEVVEGWAAPGD